MLSEGADLASFILRAVKKKSSSKNFKISVLVFFLAEVSSGGGGENTETVIGCPERNTLPHIN